MLNKEIKQEKQTAIRFSKEASKRFTLPSKNDILNKHGGVSKRSQRGGLENRLGESPRGFESLRLRQ